MFNKPLNRHEREANAKTMDRIVADNSARQKNAEKAQAKRKDEDKNELLDQMDQIIPRSERSDFTGRSRLFSFPADAWERAFGKKQRTT